MKKGQNASALEAAASILSRTSKSEQALFDRLLEKGYDESESAEAVARLVELKLLDDAEYMRSLVRGYRAKGYGELKIRQELKGKKFREEGIKEALSQFDPDEQALHKLIEQKVRGKALTPELKKKLYDMLFRRGLLYPQIEQALSRYFSVEEE